MSEKAEGREQEQRGRPQVEHGQRCKVQDDKGYHIYKLRRIRIEITE